MAWIMPFSNPHAEPNMKTLVCFTSLAVLVVGCARLQPATQHLAYAGGDGSSCEQAVVIGETKYRETGTLAEKLWLEKRYPGYCQTRQSVIRSDGKQFDLVEFATADGQARKVYFDSTSFANK
jgi:hypothetical protein